nr:response regulator [uncultured Catonella sp.]
MRILHLEDSVSKHSEIRSVLLSCGIKADDIVWVMNLTDGICELKEAAERGEHFDLAITDMYYPVEPGGYEEKDTGDKFVKFVKKERLNLPVIICSSVNIKDGGVFGCVWFSAISNWELELRGMIEELK